MIRFSAALLFVLLLACGRESSSAPALTLQSLPVQLADERRPCNGGVPLFINGSNQVQLLNVGSGALTIGEYTFVEPDAARLFSNIDVRDADTIRRTIVAFDSKILLMFSYDEVYLIDLDNATVNEIENKPRLPGPIALASIWPVKFFADHGSRAVLSLGAGIDQLYYEFDFETLRGELIETGWPPTLNFAFSEAGEVRTRAIKSEVGSKVEWKLAPSSDWQTVVEFEQDQGDAFVFAHRELAEDAASYLIFLRDRNSTGFTPQWKYAGRISKNGDLAKLPKPVPVGDIVHDSSHSRMIWIGTVEALSDQHWSPALSLNTIRELLGLAETDSIQFLQQSSDRSAFLVQAIKSNSRIVAVVAKTPATEHGVKIVCGE